MGGGAEESAVLVCPVGQLHEHRLNTDHRPVIVLSSRTDVGPDSQFVHQ